MEKYTGHTDFFGNYRYIEIHRKSGIYESRAKLHLFWGGCFVAGTRVTTPDGSAAIETLGSGDVVLAADSATGVVTERLVETLWSRTANNVGELRFDNGSQFHATYEHPIYSVYEQTYIESGDLMPGETVLALDEEDGSLAEVTLVSSDFSAPISAPVYNLRIAEDHTYFAENILVHNY